MGSGTVVCGSVDGGAVVSAPGSVVATSLTAFVVLSALSSSLHATAVEMSTAVSAASTRGRLEFIAL